jgi:hypothetical protein
MTKSLCMICIATAIACNSHHLDSCQLVVKVFEINPICQIKSVRPDILLVLSHICELTKKQIDNKGQVIHL